MVSLWFLLLMTFMQTYIVLVMQTMLYDGTIRVFHMQTRESEQLAHSLFLHVAVILAKKGGWQEGQGVEFLTAGQGTERCYATIKTPQKGKFTIVIEQNGDGRTSHKGAITLQENGFVVTAFRRGNDKAL